MEKKVEKDINITLTEEEAKNAKGFHITITDLDKNEVVYDEKIKGIIASVAMDNEEGQAFEITNCTAMTRINMLKQLEDIAEKCMARIAEKMGDEK